MSTSTELAKVRWACRRGMLELDLLLGDFFEAAYADLSDVQQQRFQRLLQIGDQDLFDCFLKDKTLDDPHLQQMIEQIREFAASQCTS